MTLASEQEKQNNNQRFKIMQCYMLRFHCFWSELVMMMNMIRAMITLIVMSVTMMMMMMILFNMLIVRVLLIARTKGDET